ncbi:biotin-dependent carboxyltransferase family protein [Catellatospora bangladeshensis]|uniref:Allophanate hydrolase n=1 Tax=Catellatospora bangladeshensis TaxID=310355 RepID=A0A8J3NK89_9ACTN|nr:biotin-dependent carboxyltransferase family protein [Catellatospora bangladeshensis]GIF81260.1 allophanate hydrolase [Catellatospora bangladeshensis]
MLEVIAPGPLATVQDLGRFGYAQLGVSRSGALDPAALRLANRLVGNPETDAALELTYGGTVLRAHAPLWCALTGAPAPLTVDGHPAPYGAPFALPTGALLTIGTPTHGIRSYLALAGGLPIPPVLGSRSTDTLSTLGPPPLSPGTTLPTATPPAPILRELWGRHAPTGQNGNTSRKIGAVDFVPWSAPGAEIRVRVRFGPREGWFAEPGELLRRVYTVGQGDRIGVRLDGPPLARAIAGELPSEGLVAGAVQVPGDGRPLVFLADHPTTGGYPVIAVVHPADLGLLAQARPGTRVVFHGSQR